MKILLISVGILGDMEPLLALTYGCASMIIPHIIDQFVWDKIVAKAGAGPKGIRIGSITTSKLEPRFLDLMNRPDYKNRAEELARKMDQEDFQEEIHEAIIGP